jgi:hypothetical protein
MRLEDLVTLLTITITVTVPLRIPHVEKILITYHCEYALEFVQPPSPFTEPWYYG